MPELPEVETIRRQLAPQLEGRRLVGGGSHPSPKFAAAPAAIGATVTAVGRRGKYLLLALDDGHELIVHLGMTGSLRVIEDTPDHAHDHRAEPVADPVTIDAYVRAHWELDDGRTLVFRDVRRFGRIAVVPSGDHRSLPTLAELGPEPFDEAFDGVALWEGLRGSRRHLKTQILSQRPVAGVGNIYADEAFWLAGVNPADRTISRPRAAALANAIRTALAAGLDHGGTTLRDYVDAAGERGENQHHLHAYGRWDEPCERCGDLLRRRVLDGRTTSWCPTCQPSRR